MDDVKTTMHTSLSAGTGIVYKRIVKNNRTKNKITLVSDNPSYQPYQVNTEDVIELWQHRWSSIK